MGKSKFLVGAILGAAAAALLTPVTGKKTRDSVKKAAKRVGVPTDGVAEAVNSIVEKGTELLSKADGTKDKKTKTKR